jgi:hypothetical protein
MLCLYRVKKHGAWFCTNADKPHHCSVLRVLACIVKDLIRSLKKEAHNA